MMKFQVPASTAAATATAEIAAPMAISIHSRQPKRRLASPRASARRAEAARLHRRRELRSAPDRQHEQRERHPEEAPDAPAVGDPARAARELERRASRPGTARPSEAPRARRARTARAAAAPGRARRRGRSGRPSRTARPTAGRSRARGSSVATASSIDPSLICTRNQSTYTSPDVCAVERDRERGERGGEPTPARSAARTRATRCPRTGRAGTPARARPAADTQSSVSTSGSAMSALAPSLATGLRCATTPVRARESRSVIRIAAISNTSRAKGLHDIQVVRDRDDRRPLVAVEPVAQSREERHELGPRAGVLAEGRLVEHEHRGASSRAPPRP